MPEAGLARLQGLWARLPAPQRETLLAFAEFLAARHGAEPPAPPLDLPRPPGESVVQALQRLRRTYPMLEPGGLLQEASGLMSRHVLEDCPAEEVIDELERLFRRRYQAWAAEGAAGDGTG